MDLGLQDNADTIYADYVIPKSSPIFPGIYLSAFLVGFIYGSFCIKAQES